METDIQVIVELDNHEKYKFNSGAEAYIFHTGIYHNMINEYGVKEILQYVALVFNCYLADSNRTPLGNLCDYVADNWNTIRLEQTIKYYKLLDDFYEQYIGA